MAKKEQEGKAQESMFHVIGLLLLSMSSNACMA